MSYPPNPFSMKRKKPEETLPPVTYEESLPKKEQSFGNEFNLIRAVDEFGNKRIVDIDKRLKMMQIEQAALEQERKVLCELTAVVQNFKKEKNND